MFSVLAGGGWLNERVYEICPSHHSNLDIAFSLFYLEGENDRRKKRRHGKYMYLSWVT